MNENESTMKFYQQVYGGSWITQGLWVAAELGIADLLVDGPLKVEKLAEKTHSDSHALYRVLRALASVGVFAEDGNGRFMLTPLAEALGSNHPAQQRAFATMMGAEFHQVWGQLLHSVQTGKQGSQHGFGALTFEYLMNHPDRHAIYDAAMNAVHGPETGPMLDAYDFSGFRTVVDVGGGNGSTLIQILTRHPNLEGILFELPGVADRGQSMISDSGVSDRCRAVGGDFFASVPAGADAYVLRHVVHDWDDDKARDILGRCREAMDPQGRILVVETVIPGGNEPSFGKWLDLMMLLVGGRERTENEYRALFDSAGLKLARIVATTSEVSVVEGVPA